MFNVTLTPGLSAETGEMETTFGGLSPCFSVVVWSAMLTAFFCSSLVLLYLLTEDDLWPVVSLMYQYFNRCIHNIFESILSYKNGSLLFLLWHLAGKSEQVFEHVLQQSLIWSENQILQGKHLKSIFSKMFYSWI